MGQKKTGAISSLSEKRKTATRDKKLAQLRAEGKDESELDMPENAIRIDATFYEELHMRIRHCGDLEQEADRAMFTANCAREAIELRTERELGIRFFTDPDKQWRLDIKHKCLVPVLRPPSQQMPATPDATSEASEATEATEGAESTAGADLSAVAEQPTEQPTEAAEALA